MAAESTPKAVVETIGDYLAMKGDPQCEGIVVRLVEHLEDAGYIAWGLR